MSLYVSFSLPFDIHGNPSFQVRINNGGKFKVRLREVSGFHIQRDGLEPKGKERLGDRSTGQPHPMVRIC